jgi:hypothetical protein
VPGFKLAPVTRGNQEETEGGSLSERAEDALTQTSTFKKEVEEQ